MTRNIIAVIISLFSLGSIALIWINKLRQPITQITFHKRNALFLHLLAVGVWIYGAYYSSQYGLSVSIPSFFFGVFLIFFARTKIQISYVGIFNGFFFVPWKDIVFYRWDRSKKGHLYYKTRGKDPANLWIKRYCLRVPKERREEINSILKRHGI